MALIYPFPHALFGSRRAFFCSMLWWNVVATGDFSKLESCSCHGKPLYLSLRQKQGSSLQIGGGAEEGDAKANKVKQTKQ